ncbi:transposase [Tsukamurella spumae]|uniref:Transposase n=1 Tax=Tsukamurella spumae TaxID=44753 RepID=A0A846X5S4_9ACTN|nr:transposase [Tsukamurella spumae]NKY19542.1 transposase [Tsukamurella spumae]
MPKAKPEEFRRRAVKLAREDGASVAQVAKDLGISESGLRRWMSIDDVDAGRREGLSTSERAELAQLRRDKKRLEQEVEILKRASAYFARENILPK